MNAIMQRLNVYPREQISLLPTPFHFLNNISKLTDCNIYIKRDDLTGFSLGGNKTRKFDFLIADALKKKCDTILGIGANQSNFCRILSGVGSSYGLEVHLVLNGKKPEKPTGNLLIDHMLGANIHHIDTKDSEERMQYALEIHQQLQDKGQNVYFLPPGGSTPIGTLGYAAGFAEILNDMDKHRVSIDRIFHASSSAGTQAGLVLGQQMSDWEGRIIGISVDVPEEKLKDNVYKLAREAGELIDIEVDKNLVLTDDSYIGEGYGIRTTACEEAVDILARKEGVFLDYVYTGKAAAGMLDYCRSGKISSSENILFLHTGGYVELFE